MQDRPATPQQKKFARDLGIDFDSSILQSELAVLIRRAAREAKRNAPINTQLRRAKELGMTVRPGTTKDELKKLIDDEAEKQAQAAMRGNPNLRKGKEIYFENRRYRINSVVKYRGRWVANLVEVSSGNRRSNVSIIHLKNAQAAK